MSVRPPFDPLRLERGITGESFLAHGGRRQLQALSRLVAAGQLGPRRVARSVSRRSSKSRGGAPRSRQLVRRAAGQAGPRERSWALAAGA
jgi:hypothetical protein